MNSIFSNSELIHWIGDTFFTNPQTAEAKGLVEGCANEFGKLAYEGVSALTDTQQIFEGQGIWKFVSDIQQGLFVIGASLMVFFFIFQILKQVMNEGREASFYIFLKPFCMLVVSSVLMANALTIGSWCAGLGYGVANTIRNAAGTSTELVVDTAGDIPEKEQMQMMAFALANDPAPKYPAGQTGAKNAIIHRYSRDIKNNDKERYKTRLEEFKTYASSPAKDHFNGLCQVYRNTKNRPADWYKEERNMLEQIGEALSSGGNLVMNAVLGIVCWVLQLVIRFVVLKQIFSILVRICLLPLSMYDVPFNGMNSGGGKALKGLLSASLSVAVMTLTCLLFAQLAPIMNSANMGSGLLLDIVFAASLFGGSRVAQEIFG